MIIRRIERIADLPEGPWDALAGDNPFLRHAFLDALQQSGCASPETGWEACFLTAWEADVLIGALPLYFKTHSWGEFVFDWAWAEAYERAGLSYYPKLLSAVPFIPVTGPRLLAARADTRAALLDAALELARETGVSSLHLLFPNANQAAEMEGHGLMLRRGMQLHWRNPGHADFADYLAGLRRDKRKKVQQERRKVQEAGIRFEHLRGTEISAGHWRHFMACYVRTHQQFNSPIALNLDFFERISARMADNILLIVALRDDQPIASALNFVSRDALYGRSWGTLEYHSGLHFETCYYQAIDYCIANNIALFEGGAQGEHKLARGFLPETTWSAHWLADARFAGAIDAYLKREAVGMNQYVDELNERAPYKPMAP
jgi:predicted N-acyltransferase